MHLNDQERYIILIHDPDCFIFNTEPPEQSLHDSQELKQAKLEGLRNKNVFKFVDISSIPNVTRIYGT